MDALREAGLVTFLDLKMIGSIRQYPGRTWSLGRLKIITQQVETDLDCIGEAEGWREEVEVAILRLKIQGFKVNCFFGGSTSVRLVSIYMSYYHYMTTWEGGWDNCKTSFANNLRGESDGRLEAILSILGKLKHSKTARTRNFVSSKQGFQSRLTVYQYL